MNVLAIGLGEEQVNAIQYATSKGLRVIGVDRTSELPGVNLVHEFYQIDLKNEEEILEIARDKQIVFIIPSTIGSLLTTIGRINDELNLTGVSKEAALLFTDKEKYFNFLNSIDMYVPRRKVLKRPTVDKAKSIISAFQLPCILKPSKGSGSRGVIHIEQKIDIQSAAQYAVQELVAGESLIIEEFVAGQEYGIDFRIENTQVELLCIRKKVMTEFPYRQEIGYYSHHSLDDVRNRFMNQLKLMIKSLNNVSDCLGHIDAIITDDTCYFIEVSLRPAGLGIMYNYLPYAIGFNPVHNMIDVLSGTANYNHPQNLEHYVAMFLIDLPCGTITSVPTEQKTIDNSSIIKCLIKLEKGKEVKQVKSGKDILDRGFIIMKHNNFQIIEEQKKNFFNSFTVKGESKNEYV